MLENVELVARVPMFLVKKTFDCPLTNQKTDSIFCLGCGYCKRHIRIIDYPFLPNVEMTIECGYK